MILGIDIGGTHTDAVCVRDNEIVATAKALTGDDLVESILGAIHSLGVEYQELSRVVLSTTLSTNAIIEKKYPPTGMIISAGPGIDPRNYFLSDDFFLVDGAIDHRGREYQPIRTSQVREVVKQLKKRDIQGVGVVSKFSARNSAHEKAISSLITDDFAYLSMGHRMSGSRNFPRRINTTYFNTAVMPMQQRFVRSVQQALNELGIRAPLLFLKADGGTYTARAADRLPVETIMSGPAASMMGGVALSRTMDPLLVLDIGGTTTDIGILLGGAPLLEKGACVGGLRTLVRGLQVRSVGAGGDSAVSIEDGRLRVGPQRQGPPAAMGGPCATPTDALAVLGEFDQGDIERARDAIDRLAAELGEDREAVARSIIHTMVENIHRASQKYIEEVNSQPVYTIHEMLHPDIIDPQKVMVIGGPACNLRPYLDKAFGAHCLVPEYSAVANALGAALARTTAQITLHADTQLRTLSCPELDISEEIPRRYRLEDMRSFGIHMLKKNAEFLGLDSDFEMDVVDEQCFNMVRGFSAIGKNMRLKIQTRPGILSAWSMSS